MSQLRPCPRSQRGSGRWSDLVAGCCCDCRIGRDAALYGGSFLADPMLWPWHSAGWHCWCDGDGFGDGQRNCAGCDIGCWDPTFCSGRLVRFRCRACNRTDRNCCRRGDRGDRYHTLGTLSVTLRTGFVCCPRRALARAAPDAVVTDDGVTPSTFNAGQSTASAHCKEFWLDEANMQPCGPFSEVSVAGAFQVLYAGVMLAICHPLFCHILRMDALCWFLVCR